MRPTIGVCRGVKVSAERLGRIMGAEVVHPMSSEKCRLTAMPWITFPLPDCGFW
ncbi:hypothetical protein [Butyrivibrio sp. WCD3002]|uniref:hypothetical protein n=1 Tax=Butyrivibrio sp. WCD3002 TaxID=1280676 RepID=UPI001A993231|nr:hypothetical protein [Butyrivibrio sp. WCD3002]